MPRVGRGDLFMDDDVLVTSQQSPRVDRRAIRRAFAREDDPYAGADATAARRLVPLLVALCTLLTLAFLPMMPPTHALGNAGWAVAAALALGQLATIRWLADTTRQATFNQLLGGGPAGVGAVAVPGGLAAGPTPSALLFRRWLAPGVGVPPPRRAVPFLAVVLVADALPLLY